MAGFFALAVRSSPAVPRANSPRLLLGFDSRVKEGAIRAPSDQLDRTAVKSCPVTAVELETGRCG